MRNRTGGNRWQTYREIAPYLRESLPAIYGAFFVFLFGGILGFVFMDHLAFLDSVLRELVEATRGFSVGRLMVFIFANNVQSTLYGIVLGIAFGVFPVCIALANGIVLGYVLAQSWIVSGAHDFWRLFPHGIFELPAVFIAIGLGMRLGMFVFARRRWEELVRRTRYSLLIFLYVIVPLLAIAAVIEGLLIAFT